MKHQSNKPLVTNQEPLNLHKSSELVKLQSNEPKVPNPETLAAMMEAEAIASLHKSRLAEGGNK